MISDQWPVISDQWPVISDQWPVISDQWPVISGQWPVISGQWPAGKVKAPHWAQMARTGREGRKGRKGRMGRIKRRLPRLVHTRFIGLSRNFLSCKGIHTYSYTHTRNVSISAQHQKTYGRFLGMIFWGGSESLVMTGLELVSTQKISKNRKIAKKNVIFFHPDGNFSYRLRGIIHREQDEPLGPRSSRLTVSNSGRAMCQLYFLRHPVRLAAGFAARPGRRIPFFKRPTLIGRTSPQDGGLRPITNSQNFSPASGSDEYYKTFADGGQGGISLLVKITCQIL